MFKIRPPKAPDVVRIAEGVNGAVSFRSSLRLRFDYGRVVPWVCHHADGVIAVAGPDRVRLRTPVSTRGTRARDDLRVHLTSGDASPISCLSLAIAAKHGGRLGALRRAVLVRGRLGQMPRVAVIVLATFPGVSINPDAANRPHGLS